MERRLWRQEHVFRFQDEPLLGIERQAACEGLCGFCDYCTGSADQRAAAKRALLLAPRACTRDTWSQGGSSRCNRESPLGFNVVKGCVLEGGLDSESCSGTRASWRKRPGNQSSG